jgi:hypothetical protein
MILGPPLGTSPPLLGRLNAKFFHPAEQPWAGARENRFQKWASAVAARPAEAVGVEQGLLWPRPEALSCSGRCAPSEQKAPGDVARITRRQSPALGWAAESAGTGSHFLGEKVQRRHLHCTLIQFAAGVPVKGLPRARDEGMEPLLAAGAHSAASRIRIGFT